MDINNISFGRIQTQKVNNVKTNSHLLNQKIEDKTNIARKSTSEAMDYVCTLKGSDGQSRFTAGEKAYFKEIYKAGKIDFETVERFAPSTALDMKNLVKLYNFNKETDNPNFYDDLEKHVNDLKAENKEIKEFEQNKYVPKEEFSLKEAYIGKSYGDMIFYSKDLKPIGKRTFDLNIDNMKYMGLSTERFSDNSVHTVYYDTTDAYLPTKSYKLEKRDKDNNVLSTETMDESEVSGIFNHKIKHANGKEEILSSGNVDKKTGITSVKKDFKSFDGTRTEFLYEDDPLGNRLVDYKITDKNGKVLMKNSQTFEKIDDNKYISSNNNDKYEITVDDKELTVKDLRRDLESKINFQKSCKGNKKEVLSLLKKVPGQELFDVVDSLKSINGVEKNKVLSAYYRPSDKKINTGDDLFVFLHELGHAKDASAKKTNVITLSTTGKDIFTDNKMVRKAYQEERENFNKNATDIERNMIDYFIQAKGHYQGEWGGLSELVAETNALTNSIPTKESARIGVRTEVLQQYFPKTIATIKDMMNYRNDVYAIEYYGT